jgi:hypothetical protein
MMDANSATERTEILTYGTTQMTVGDVMLREIRQSHKDKL